MIIININIKKKTLDKQSHVFLFSNPMISFMVAHRLISPTVRWCHSILAYELHHVTEILAWVHTYIATATGKKKKKQAKISSYSFQKTGHKKSCPLSYFLLQKKTPPSLNFCLFLLDEGRNPAMMF